jgi:hypothetical protein
LFVTGVVTKLSYEISGHGCIFSGLTFHSRLKIGEGHLSLRVVLSEVKKRPLRLHSIEDRKLALLVRHVGLTCPFLTNRIYKSVS